MEKKMELSDRQFLKIRVKHENWLDFEICEQPTENWKRPKRYHWQVPISHLVNRHKRESKIKFLTESLNRLSIGALGYIETRQTF